MRCFISISLPDDIKKSMASIQGMLKTAGADVSWTRPGGMHLTLKFLGDIEEEILPRLKIALSKSVDGIGPFLLGVSGVGTFPDIRRPRVIWTGIKDDGNSLVRVHRGVEDELEPIGFHMEKRRFTPHLTLGRIRSRKNMGKLLGIIEKEKDIELGRFEVDCVHLMRSELKPAGAIYTELHKVSLQ